MTRLSVTVLGSFEARLGGGATLVLPRKTQALLAYLALAPQARALRSELAALLWGDTGRAQAQQSLRQTLSGLRHALGTSERILIADARTIALERPALEVDAARFEHLVGKGTVEGLAEAVALYRGDLLAGLEMNEAPSRGMAPRPARAAP